MSRLSLRWRRPGRALLALALGGLGLGTSAAAGAGWSPPATITGCAAAAQPRVVFPSADPHTSGGPGAILWSGDPLTCGPAPAAGAAGAGVGIAPIGADDAAGPAGALGLAPGTPGLGRLFAAAATGDGRIVLATGLGADRASPAAVFEGRTDAPFGRPEALRARPGPLATATGYLGDVALATVNARSGRVELRLARHGAPGLTAPLVLSPAGGAAVSAVAVGLDYRGDALVVWAQSGWIHRRVLRASGVVERAERIAPTPPAPHLQALISDDNRGIVAWTAAPAPTRTGTIARVYLDASGAGVHFGRPRLLEQFREPPRLPLPDGSLRLVRLANEGVMMAWTGMTGGRYVVRAASVSLSAVRPAAVVSGPGGDAVLADLVTGPHGEDLALWTTAPRRAAGFDPRATELLSARGVNEAPGVAVFGPPQTVAGPGPIAGPSAAFDPAADTAVAVWENHGSAPGIAYATSGPAAVLRRGAPAAHAHTARGGPASAWWLVGLGALGAVALAGIARVVVRVRARRPAPGQRPLTAGAPPPDQPRPAG